jgi:hypothetical protein
MAETMGMMIFMRLDALIGAYPLLSEIAVVHARSTIRIAPG